ANSSSNDGDSECGCRRSCWKLYFECCALPRLAGDVDGTPVLADNVEGAKKPHGGFDARSLRVDSRVKELLELFRRNSFSGIRELDTDVGLIDKSPQNDRPGPFDGLHGILQQVHEYLV